ncbi:MAG: hypothetical protein ACI9XB_002467 [Gammaproteobacteria bacterium]|jgi:hypothetical protein
MHFSVYNKVYSSNALALNNELFFCITNYKIIYLCIIFL